MVFIELFLKIFPNGKEAIRVLMLNEGITKELRTKYGKDAEAVITVIVDTFGDNSYGIMATLCEPFSRTISRFRYKCETTIAKT